tara:strand:+ start:38614 stop:39513 length:900 start_codon:yes stop_codon:yes gene_type:complete
MNKVAVFGQSYSVSAVKEVNNLLDALIEKNVEVQIEASFFEKLRAENVISTDFPTYSSFEDLDNSFDLMFTIGGDGTILRAVTFIRDLDIPILGINTGRLGFLATINKNSIQENVQLIADSKFEVQERSLLEVNLNPSFSGLNELNFALNEVTIARKNTTSMIGVKTSLNGEYLTNYWSDGLIIATPTGSTGYSLSCNGPVISPDSKNLVITPIAPHNLNARPMVIADDTEIKLEVSSREKEYLISLDSRIISVPENTEVNIRKASFSIKTIIPQNQSFLKTLRSKLLWGEDTRNENNL